VGVGKCGAEVYFCSIGVLPLPVSVVYCVRASLAAACADEAASSRRSASSDAWWALCVGMWCWSSSSSDVLCCMSRYAFLAASCDVLALCRRMVVRLTSEVRFPLGEGAGLGAVSDGESESRSDMGVDAPVRSESEPDWLGLAIWKTWVVDVGNPCMRVLIALICSLSLMMMHGSTRPPAPSRKSSSASGPELVDVAFL
jgi:hypothetical protein